MAGDDLSQYEVKGDDDLEKYASPASPSTAAKPPVTAPKASDFVPDSDTPGKLAEGVGTGVVNLGSGIASAVRHPIDTIAGIGHTVADTYRSARGDVKGGTPGQIPLDVATGAARIAGFDEPHLAQQWSQGEGAQAVGESLPIAALDAYGAEKAAKRGVAEINGKPVTQAIRTASRNAVYDPEGKMRPLAKTGARVAGAAIGAMTPIPAGGVVGAMTGPEALRAIIPAPTDFLEQQRLGAFMNRGYRPAGELPGEGGGPVDQIPLRPTIGSPEDWATYDTQMRNLKAEASDAGTYHAARGKVGKKMNLQQRAERAYTK